MSNYETMLETIVKTLVDKPEAVEIDKKVDEMGVLMTLKVDQTDMGKVVGKQGATAKAIRTLVRAAGMKEAATVSLKILEPDGSDRSHTE